MTYIQKYKSPLGEIIMGSDGEKLIGLWFSGQKYFGMTLSWYSIVKPLPIFEQTANWLDIYFSRREPNFTPPFKIIKSTFFRESVYAALLKIPYGRTTTYGAVAEQLNSAARAVGVAASFNPISIIIPCHRVIGTNGDLKGYSGGVDRKAKLLELEGSL